MRERTPVSVFGSGLTAIDLLRNLARAGIPAFSVAAHQTQGSLLRPGWHSTFPADPRLPLKPNDPGSFPKGLRLDRAVLVPCSDDGAKAVASLPPELQRTLPARISPTAVIATMNDERIFAPIKEHNVPHPGTSMLHSLTEIAALPHSACEDAFSKPLDSLELGRSRKATGILIAGKQDGPNDVGESQSTEDRPIKAWLCPWCFSNQVRPSHRRKLEWLWSIVLHRPFRCRDCRGRFWDWFWMK